jgi:hypothetical protein
MKGKRKGFYFVVLCFCKENWSDGRHCWWQALLAVTSFPVLKGWSWRRSESGGCMGWGVGCEQSCRVSWLLPLLLVLSETRFAHTATWLPRLLKYSLGRSLLKLKALNFLGNTGHWGLRRTWLQKGSFIIYYLQYKKQTEDVCRTVFWLKENIYFLCLSDTFFLAYPVEFAQVFQLRD